MNSYIARRGLVELLVPSGWRPWLTIESEGKLDESGVQILDAP